MLLPLQARILAHASQQAGTQRQQLPLSVLNIINSCQVADSGHLASLCTIHHTCMVSLAGQMSQSLPMPFHSGTQALGLCMKQVTGIKMTMGKTIPAVKYQLLNLYLPDVQQIWRCQASSISAQLQMLCKGSLWCMRQISPVFHCWPKIVVLEHPLLHSVLTQQISTAVRHRRQLQHPVAATA